MLLSTIAEACLAKSLETKSRGVEDANEYDGKDNDDG